MTYDELIKNLQKRFDPQNNRNKKESKAIEKYLLQVSREKIRWWKLWRILPILRKQREAVFLFGQIAYSCVSEMELLRETQLDTLKIQNTQQDLLVVIKDRLKELEGK